MPATSCWYALHHIAVPQHHLNLFTCFSYSRIFGIQHTQQCDITQQRTRKTPANHPRLSFLGLLTDDAHFQCNTTIRRTYFNFFARRCWSSHKPPRRILLVTCWISVWLNQPMYKYYVSLVLRDDDAASTNFTHDCIFTYYTQCISHNGIPPCVYILHI